MSEHKLQVAVARILDASGLLWTAVPNGGKRSPITGAILKKEGVKPGVPDVLVFDWTSDNRRWGLAIELKNGKAGRTSPAQREWMDALRARGWRVEVCRSLDEVLDLLRECYPHKFPKAA